MDVKRYMSHTPFEKNSNGYITYVIIKINIYIFDHTSGVSGIKDERPVLRATTPGASRLIPIISLVETTTSSPTKYESCPI